MATSGFEQIEADIERLSLADQLRLMQRLADLIGRRARSTPTVQEDDLVAMADDPAVQRELREIEEEFAVTEADGLDRTP
jgi:hypothetical protein